ncbi:MAG: helix-turn-helix domain-containing protein [Clostridia bacterium]|nr:helix-turn-helix domain-containing protein [Clostridia bacterium]
MSDYYKKLQITLDYIEANLKTNIEVETLAELCHYSPQHYMRIFQSVVGIPVVDYIRKRKLSAAAYEIIETDQKLLDIALNYGFNSHENFTRAFSRIFDISPSGYRKLNNHAIPREFWKVTFEDSDVQIRYMNALEALLDKLKADHNIVAVILAGSLSYDQVWEKSDIDIVIVVNDDSKPKRHLCLMEDHITINGHVETRSEFKKKLSTMTRGLIYHSYLAMGTMVFCNDPALLEVFNNFGLDVEIGIKDREIAILHNLAGVIVNLNKAEKWLKVKDEPRYAYLWLIETLKHVSSIEVLINESIPTREVILQALKYNNPMIEELYIKLMDNRKNNINVSSAIEKIYEYIRQNVEALCRPILDYLRAQTEIKPLSVMEKDFNFSIDAMILNEVCDWLCEEGLLMKDSAVTYLTKKSPLGVTEPAYLRAGDDFEIIF